jgi:hypothetical protein
VTNIAPCAGAKFHRPPQRLPEKMFVADLFHAAGHLWVVKRQAAAQLDSLDKAIVPPLLVVHGGYHPATVSKRLQTALQLRRSLSR